MEKYNFPDFIPFPNVRGCVLPCLLSSVFSDSFLSCLSFFFCPSFVSFFLTPFCFHLSFLPPAVILSFLCDLTHFLSLPFLPSVLLSLYPTSLCLFFALFLSSSVYHCSLFPHLVFLSFCLSILVLCSSMFYYCLSIWVIFPFPSLCPSLVFILIVFMSFLPLLCPPFSSFLPSLCLSFWKNVKQPFSLKETKLEASQMFINPPGLLLGSAAITRFLC